MSLSRYLSIYFGSYLKGTGLWEISMNTDCQQMNLGESCPDWHIRLLKLLNQKVVAGSI